MEGIVGWNTKYSKGGLLVGEERGRSEKGQGCAPLVRAEALASGEVGD